MATLGPTSIEGIHHVAMAVRDIERALAFYEAVVPLRRVPGRASSADGPGALLRGPNAYLELEEVTGADVEPMPVHGPGITHVCFQAPAESGLYRAFVDGGADPVSSPDAPIDLMGSGVRYGYARDPDAIMFEVEQLDDPPFADPVWLAHVALASTDIDRLVEFYALLLGREPRRRVNKVTGPKVDEVTGLTDARARVAWFDVGNMVLEIWEFLTPAPPTRDATRPTGASGYDRFVLEVGDLDAEVARLRSAGLVVDAPVAGPDGGRIAYGRDPDGNRVGLLELAAESALRLTKLGA